MTKKWSIVAGDILLVVDIQNDFCTNGSLPVPHGEDIISPVNRIAKCFEHVALTQDWHPRGHHSFASAHPGRKPYDTIPLRHGVQILWPDHCVQDTDGAGLHKDLHIPHAGLVLRKGMRKEIDSYSAFFENDRTTPTGLAGYLRERGFTRVFIAGLTFDYCVRYSAEDASRHGFTAVIIEDACRAIGAAGSEEDARKSLAVHGIETVNSAALL